MALIIIFPKILSALIKIFIYTISFNKNKRDIYYCRLSGIFNSITGNKSWYRPSLFDLYLLKDKKRDAKKNTILVTGGAGLWEPI